LAEGVDVVRAVTKGEFSLWTAAASDEGSVEEDSSVGALIRSEEFTKEQAAEIMNRVRDFAERLKHTVKNPKLVWKYRSIANPYINANYATSISEENNPIAEVPDIRWLAPEYNDETYLSNRLLAFERDGWRCTKCGSQENLQAHHIELISKGTFNPMVVHRVENLQTLCADCHQRLSKD
jgi:5-methylcytosine-specific restriction endonuclease McrA